MMLGQRILYREGTFISLLYITLSAAHKFKYGTTQFF